MQHLLDVTYDFDFVLYGLSCHEREYRLCWFLNNQLGIQLEWAGALTIALKDGNASHAIYRYENLDTEMVVSLVSNRSGGSVLVPEYKQVDYLLKLEHGTDWDAQEMKEALGKIDIIRTSFNMDVDAIKNKENLIFE